MDEEPIEKKLVRIGNRGKVTEKFETALKQLNVPCTVIETLTKLKTSMPSLKSPVESSLQSKVIYKIIGPRCEACYVCRANSSSFDYSHERTQM